MKIDKLFVFVLIISKENKRKIGMENKKKTK
jgi:hypothetical protein